MKLTNGREAIVDPRKLRDYCLSATHPEGRHKARRFRAELGLEATDWQMLRAALLAAASDGEAMPERADHWGARYTIDFEVQHRGRRATIRSGWIVRTGENRPRFLTCYLK